MADKQQRIIRKALERKHYLPCVISRAMDADGESEDKTIELSFASDTPITHFSWSKWDYIDIQLSLDKKAIRTERLENGAAFLMGHDTYDWRSQVGVIDGFSIDKGEGKCRATVRFSDSPDAQQVYRDMEKRVRQNISVGFMIHKLTLVEERKGEPDLYRADDWEPYEISSVSVPADISVGVQRAMVARRDGMETCPDCEMPLEDCTCEENDTTTDSESRSKRQINPKNGERKMGKENEGAGTDPVVETRSREAEIMDFAGIFGDEGREIARDMIAASGSVTIDDVRSKIKEHRAAANPPTPTPVADPQALARRQNGVEYKPDGEIIVDAQKREILESRGFDLTDKQLEATCTRAYKLAFRDYIRKGIGGVGMDAVRTLNEGKDSDGGFLVPADFLAQMVQRESASTALMGLVTRLQTGSNALVMPRNNYSASNIYRTPVRVNWVGGDSTSGPSAEESNANLFGNIQIPIHTAMMYLDVTNNQIEDTGFDILGWLTSQFSETANVAIEDNIINGTGIGRPQGILMNPNGTDEPAQVVSGSGSALTADGLLNLFYALLGRYRKNARWIFNSTSTELAIAKLKDSQNRYLFTYGTNDHGIASAQPTALLGFPIVSSDFMPDIAANAFPIIWGDPSGYYLAERVGFSVQVLNEIVQTANKVRVLGRLRIGGQVAEDWKLKVQKVST